MTFAGSQDNRIFGEIRVMQGTLNLAMTGGAKAFQGGLVVGSVMEAAGNATVNLNGNEQFRMLNTFDVALNTVTVLSTGVLNFNGSSQTIGNLVLTTGVSSSSEVNLGGGTLTLGGASITLNAFQGSSGSSVPATISGGTIDLGEFFSGAGGGLNKTITVNDTQLPNVAPDLHISANIVGDPLVSLVQAGTGTLRLSGDNSGLTGPYIMAGGGIVEVAMSTTSGYEAFGSGLLSLQNGANVVKAVLDPLELPSTVRKISNTISLDGNVSTLGTDLAFNGNVTLTGDRTILVMVFPKGDHQWCHRRGDLRQPDIVEIRSRHARPDRNEHLHWPDGSQRRRRHAAAGRGRQAGQFEHHPGARWRDAQAGQHRHEFAPIGSTIARFSNWKAGSFTSLQAQVERPRRSASSECRRTSHPESSWKARRGFRRTWWWSAAVWITTPTWRSPP